MARVLNVKERHTESGERRGCANSKAVWRTLMAVLALRMKAVTDGFPTNTKRVTYLFTKCNKVYVTFLMEANTFPS